MLEIISLRFTLLAAMVGTFAYIFVNVYTQPEMIFGWYYNLIEKLPTWLAKPLGLCDLCMSGQLALWIFLAFFWDYYPVWPIKTAIVHALYISISVLTVKLLR